MKAFSFGFGDRRQIRHTEILPQIRINGPVYLKIDTYSFDGSNDERNSPPVIASSDRKLQWHFAGIDHSRSFISHDGAHLVPVERDSARLKHWDLRNPTLTELGAVTLPGVEKAHARKWLLHGKETMMKDAIPEQLHQIRFSPKCKIVTVVTVNDCSVVINVLLTFNFQLIYQHVERDPTWPYMIPTTTGFTESDGLNIFALRPAQIFRTPQGLHYCCGVLGILLSLPETYTKIKAIEEYFDFSPDRLTALSREIDNPQVRPMCKFGWRPGFTERNDPEALSREFGITVETTETDARRQLEFYKNVFDSEYRAVRMKSTPAAHRYFVPHLFSFDYEWNTKGRVSVFGVIMKHEYLIISIGPTPNVADTKMDIIRTLYVSDIRSSEADNEFVEIYKKGINFFLHVCKRQEGWGAYSGAPMPNPIWTILSPHFIEDDAWYDTFIINRGRSVTMPTGWISTPNPALTLTTNYRAYFEPYTFSLTPIVDYGHRARSAYVVPKYLLWKEYGLRRLQKPNTGEIFLGGGRYMDTLGNYLRSVYDDKTYNESAALFPTAFALACNEDYSNRTTERIDAFFRRLHQEKNILLGNSHAISCTLPLTCRTRPTALLSFMRHLVAYPHKINDVGAVEVKNGSTKPMKARFNLDSRWYRWRVWITAILEMFAVMFVHLFIGEWKDHTEPHISHVTLPLPGFCSFRYRLYRLPQESGNRFSRDAFWAFIRAVYCSTAQRPSLDSYLLESVQSSGSSAASPFTRMVEEILNIRDRELQLSFLRIPWLEKILAWKMKTFGLRIYLTRTVIPTLLLFAVHLTASVLLTQSGVKRTSLPVTFLACIEAVASCFILSVKIRQLYRIPRLFLRSVFNYIEGTALCLGFTMFFLVISKNVPSRAFLGFSTLLLWIGTILMLRVYRPIGMLLLLITETMLKIFPFLILLSSIIIGMYLYT